MVTGRPPPLDIVYPATDRGPHRDTRHGHAIEDPYRWLEGEEVGPVADWTAAQQKLTDAFFARGPEQAAFRVWLRRFLDRPYVFHAVDTRRRRFMLEDRPGLDQPVLLARAHAGGQETLVVGPGDLAGDESGILVQESIFPSPCGRYVAYFVKAPGADFARLKVKDVETGATLSGEYPETVLAAVSWTADSGGFFYNQNQGSFIDPARRSARPDGLWRHVIGRDVGDDVLVHGMTWPEAHAVIPTVSADGRFLFVNQIKLVADISALSVIALDDHGAPAGEPVALAESGRAAFSYMGENEGRYYFETNLGAPAGRVIAFDLSGFPTPELVEVVGEAALPLARSTRFPKSERAVVTGRRIYLTYLDGPAHRLMEFGLDGARLRELRLPPAHSVAGSGGDRYGALGAAVDGGLLIDLWTFTHAPTAWSLDLTTQALTLVAPDRPPPGLAGVEVESVFYPAPDGTRIPASIIARRATPRDGSAPVVLYGYGAAGMSITPEFSLDIAAWVAAGGIYVIANIRGGGEYGERWYAPTIGAGKPVTFDDFCAAADYLIGRGLAAAGRVGIRGVSAGGLTVGAAMVRRPDLFGAVVAEIPLLDPLSAGRDYWSAQLAPWLGDPTADPAAFDYIRVYSPLQTLRAGRSYPPTLVVIADGDAQLLTDGARKFVATLQALPAARAPCLLHVIRGAGHGGWSISQQLDVASRELAFLAAVLDGPLNLPPEPS